MCRRPVLAQPNYNKPFVLHTDASAYGVGAILLQEGEIPPNVKTSKPLLHPIAYYSATFIQAESVTLLRALRPDVGRWVTLSPRYWTGKPSRLMGAGLPTRRFRVMTQVGLPSLLAV